MDNETDTTTTEPETPAAPETQIASKDRDRYYIYWQNSEKNGKWQLIEATPEKMAAAIKQGAAYFTTTLFKNSKGHDPKKPEPIRCGHLYFDFDDKEQPENALKDMLKLVSHLQEIYSLDSYDFKYWLSGGKGFHACIPEKVFGEMAVNGLTSLPIIYKKMVMNWKATLELNSLDMAIYNSGKGRMFRIENIQRPDNGKYKVQLTYDELTLPYSELIELSAAPRTIDDIDIDCLKPDSEITENTELAALFTRTQKEIADLNNIDSRVSTTTRFTAVQQQFLNDNIPPCISHILAANPPKTEHVNFNRLLMVLIPYFQHSGRTLEQALNYSSTFLETYQHSDTYRTAQERITAFKAMWLYIQTNGNYKFDCKFVKGLHLAGGKAGFDCLQCEAGKPFEAKGLPFCFWKEDVTKKGELVLKIYERELYMFLEKRGYRNAKIHDVPVLVRIIDNVVEEVQISDIRNTLIKDFMAELPDQITDNFFKVQLEEILLSKIKDYISIEKLQTIQKQKLKFYSDTANQTVFFFKNGGVECTAAGFTLKPYNTLTGLVWKNNIIDHNINLNNEQAAAPQATNDYTKFLKNVCTNPETKTVDTARYNALLTVHGYLLNRYNQPAYPKTVVFSDGNLAEDSNGGTGKGVICHAISRVRQQAYIDGKTTDFKSQFAFQSVGKDTEIILVDDVRKQFNFEDFFGKITYGYTIEKKYQQAFQFTQETNPKTVITTNFSVKGTGASFERRKYEIELLPFYGVNRTPEQDFGTLFVWNSEQWNSFYNFMFETCKAYHAAGNRMIEYNSETLEMKKLQTEIGQDFIDFADSLDRNEYLRASFIIENYKKTLSERGKQTISEATFGNKLKRYCDYNDIKLEKKIAGEKHSRYLLYSLEVKKHNQNTETVNGGYSPPQQLNAPVHTSINLSRHIKPEPEQLSHMAEKEHTSNETAPEPPALKCKAYCNGDCYAFTMFLHKSGKPTPCNIKTCQHKERTNINELITPESVAA